MVIKPMFFHKLSMTSTYDTSESIATLPPESNVDDDKIRSMLAPPLYLQEREKKVQTDHSFITLSEQTQCQVHLTSEKVQGNLSRCSHTEESRVKTHFPTEKAFLQDINQFKEKVKLSSGSLIWKEAARAVLEEQRDHLLAEAKSEILKQECRRIITENRVAEKMVPRIYKKNRNIRNFMYDCFFT